MMNMFVNVVGKLISTPAPPFWHIIRQPIIHTTCSLHERHHSGLLLYRCLSMYLAVCCYKQRYLSTFGQSRTHRVYLSIGIMIKATMTNRVYDQCTNRKFANIECDLCALYTEDLKTLT